MTPAKFDAEVYLDAALALSGVPLDPAWRADILQHLQVAANLRAALDQAPPDSDRLALAGVFRVAEIGHD